MFDADAPAVFAPVPRAPRGVPVPDELPAAAVLALSLRACGSGPSLAGSTASNEQQEQETQKQETMDLTVGIAVDKWKRSSFHSCTKLASLI